MITRPSELFDAIRAGMERQQWRRSTVPFRSFTGEKPRYRNPEGLGCAIGVLIPTNKYTPQFEVRASLQFNPDILAAADVAHNLWPLCKHIQTLHDVAATADEWRTAFDAFEQKELGVEESIDQYAPDGGSTPDQGSSITPGEQ